MSGHQSILPAYNATSSMDDNSPESVLSSYSGNSEAPIVIVTSSDGYVDSDSTSGSSSVTGSGTTITLGSTSPIRFPTPSTSDSDVDADIEVSNYWLRSETVPSFLAIPLIYGLQRKIVEATNGSVVCYEAEYSGEILRNLDEVYQYLVNNKIRIPIGFFSFDPAILANTVSTADPDSVLVKDLTGGKETIPIPVICHKTIKPRPLASYIKKSFLTEDLKKNDFSLKHDEGFLVCCNCPDDCKNKMNCPCFLKTLDNCSKTIRRKVGDDKVGYNFQRLDQEFLSGIFECNKLCKCRKTTCFNRVVQNGSFCKLEVFMTRKKGWGVRARVDIPKGTFICTYAGAIVGADYADEVSKDVRGGKWKFLSELRLGEEGKDGYEEEVVEPDVDVEATHSGSNFSRDCQVGDSNFSEDCQVGESNFSGDCQVGESEFSGDCQVGESNFSGDCQVGESNFVRTAARDAEFSQDSSVIEKSKSFLVTPRDREARRVVETQGDSTDSGQIPPKKIHPIVRTKEEMKLLADLAMQSLRRTTCHLSFSLTVPHKYTEFAFRSDLKWTHSPKVPCLPEKNKETETTATKAKSGKKKLAQMADKNARISRNMAIGTANSVKLDGQGDNQLPHAYKRDLKIITKKRVRSSFPFSFTRKRIKKTRGFRQKATLRKRLGATKVSERLHPLLDFSLSVDGIDYKNVGGYINHSCRPNVFPQYVFWNCHDLRLPVIAFFASKNISRGEEIAWNYKYESGEFRIKGKSRKRPRGLPCYCDADDCRRTMFVS